MIDQNTVWIGDDLIHHYFSLSLFLREFSCGEAGGERSRREHVHA